MPGDDIKEHATSEHDFYELLDVTFETSESDIRRAYRKAALKYHPDKNAGKPEVIEKFHLLQIAYDVLSDPAVKALYDNARRARKEKEERHQAFDSKRRKMKEDLERGESAFLKRKRPDEDAYERELQRLAEDGRRRRHELQEATRRKLEEEDRLDHERKGETIVEKSVQSTASPAPQGGSQVSEIDRSVKVRWIREGSGESIDKEGLSKLFETFGPVEFAFLLGDKKKRIRDRKEKTMVASGVVVFTTVVGSHAAVEAFKKKSHPEFAAFDSVYWAANKEPDFAQYQQSTPSSVDSRGTSFEEQILIRLKTAEKKRLEKLQRKQDEAATESEQTPSKPSNDQANGNGLPKVPSFAFSSPANFKTPQGSPFAKTAFQSPSLERLRNEEIRRLEEEDRKEDEEAAKSAEV